MSVNIQVLQKRANRYVKRKLRKYLTQPQDDPLADALHWTKLQQRRKIREVAGSLQHYGQPLLAQRSVAPKDHPSRITEPVLMDEIDRDPLHDWSERKYRLCIYGQREVVQEGDLIITHEDCKCMVKNFFYSADSLGTVFIHADRVKVKSEFPSTWQQFIPSDDEVIVTDQHTSVPLGSLKKVYPRDSIKLSPLVLSNQCLMERKASSERADTSLVARIMVEGFLTCRKSMLHLNSLVLLAARYLNLRCSGFQFSQLIQKDFGAFRSELDNDLEDEAEYEGTQFTMSHRIPILEDECNFCRQQKALVVQVSDAVSRVHQCCEPCYVRLRNLYRMFALLLPLRKTCHQKKMLLLEKDKDDILDVLFDGVQKLIRACPFTTDTLMTSCVGVQVSQQRHQAAVGKKLVC